MVAHRGNARFANEARLEVPDLIVPGRVADQTTRERDVAKRVLCLPWRRAGGYSMGMGRAKEALRKELMELDPADRAEVAEDVLQSLNATQYGNLSPAWEDEIRHRLRDADQAELIPGEEVFREIEADLLARRGKQSEDLSLHSRGAGEILRQGVFWYEEKREGLGAQFAAEVQRAIRLLVASPLRWPVRHGTHRYVLRGFPYTIAYLTTDAEVQIVAIAHHRLDPGPGSNGSNLRRRPAAVKSSHAPEAAWPLRDPDHRGARSDLGALTDRLEARPCGPPRSGGRRPPRAAPIPRRRARHRIARRRISASSGDRPRPAARRASSSRPRRRTRSRPSARRRRPRSCAACSESCPTDAPRRSRAAHPSARHDAAHERAGRAARRQPGAHRDPLGRPHRRRHGVHSAQRHLRRCSTRSAPTARRR